jgi:hypothetical protein
VKTRVFVLSCLLTLVVPAFVYASMEPSLNANVPFQFTAEGKVYPAGNYTFTPTDNQSAIRIEGPNKAEGFGVVITRLAAQFHTTATDAHLVFDELGNKHILSELWIPGEDGYLLHVTKEKHTHRVLHVKL